MLLLLLLCMCLPWIEAKTHTFRFRTSWKNVTFLEDDGQTSRVKEMISFNDEWPLPEIRVRKGDRVQLYLTNGFDDDTTTSLHFHGLFHNTSLGNLNQMDGPSMVTQCPITPGDTYLYNFTVPDQVGTYWYHAHNGAQYGDGMRGTFVIEDPDVPFHYDHDYTVMLADLYYKSYKDSEAEFLSRYNPTGAEPIPQHLLFNDHFNDTLKFDTNTTYLLRFVNAGLFVSQYITLEDHEFTIVEIDGVYVKPKKANLIYIAAGQRIGVLVHSKLKETAKKNYALMQIMDKTMLDVIPKDLKLSVTNQIQYDPEWEYPRSLYDDITKYPYLREEEIHERAVNDFYLEPLGESLPLYKQYSKQIVFDVKMDNLGDGVNYAFFNNITYTSPRLPILTTVLTSGKLATDMRIFSDNTNTHIFERNEIIEIVLNNYDTGRHPFHLHGHNFQVVQKSIGFNESFGMTNPNIPQEELTVPYDENNPLMEFPKYPVIRDTIVLEPNGHVVIRFKANNPGVWLFHCHVDWHLQQGLAAVFIEDPLTLQEREVLSDNYEAICESSNIPTKGNSAGNSDDWFNLDGLPRQPKELPSGFTFKGYVAMLLSIICGLLGLWAITIYGLSDVIPDDEKLYGTLTKLLDDNNISHS